MPQAHAAGERRILEYATMKFDDVEGSFEERRWHREQLRS